MRVRTLFARSARAAAEYYGKYLAKDAHEIPGRWTGRQAPELDLIGDVFVDDLSDVLAGLDPRTGDPLGRPHLDRITTDGKTIQAVGGFDATFSAPKSLSIWWGLTGDERLAECHDIAVRAAASAIEQYGSTTRIRSNGRRMHVDTNGLTMAVFRQSTSRADDPQLHSHVIISSKVRTPDGRWYALDARVLKKHQRIFGGLYQSVLRAELTKRFGVAFDDIDNGLAEIAGVPVELIAQVSKRAADIDIEMDQRVGTFIDEIGREPTRFERAAIEREVSRDTRAPKTGRSPADLRARWIAEAAALGIDVQSLTASIAAAARNAPKHHPVSVESVLAELAEHRSVWHRLDILRTLCDLAPPQPGHDGASWATALEQAVDTVLADCIDLDPAGATGQRRDSDDRSIWTEPIAAQATSEYVLAQEERILIWAMSTQVDDPCPAVDIDPLGLDGAQLEAASAVAGEDQLVIVVGPAGAGKTRMLDTAVFDLQDRSRPVLGVAPSARGAEVLHWEANLEADTVAKLIHDLDHSGPESIAAGLPSGTTLIVDEAGMLNTADLHRLVDHVERHRWRLVLVGDPHQLAPVGRGGMYTELCATVRTVELDQLHRFTEPWEASASLALRRGDTKSLDVYEAFDRIRPGRLDQHLDTIADLWLDCERRRETLAITTTRNDDVVAINARIQERRAGTGQLDPNTISPIGDEWAMVGDVVATRHNDRRLRTSRGDHVRNRERWIVTTIHPNGDLAVSRLEGHGAITLPAAYAAEYVELAYATTEYGAQGITADRGLTLATTATTGRGLYVGMTRGRAENLALVVTDESTLETARDALESTLAVDRADIPAIRYRRDVRQDLLGLRATPALATRGSPGLSLEL
ncbi:MobF family relaxase [Ilumatobacter sp.]|uniref:MobF family relaxase n=1 Tax=Ilumatobacter sp. TaxID=1967498 RepID=UPI003C704EDC